MGAIKEKNFTKEMGEKIFAEWRDGGAYNFDEKSKLPVYSIDTPPPYVNTPVHIGQVTTYVLMDFFARYRRMTGHEVLFPLGLDRNGLPMGVYPSLHRFMRPPSLMSTGTRWRRWKRRRA